MEKMRMTGCGQEEEEQKKFRFVECWLWYSRHELGGGEEFLTYNKAFSLPFIFRQKKNQETLVRILRQGMLVVQREIIFWVFLTIKLVCIKNLKPRITSGGECTAKSVSGWDFYFRGYLWRKLAIEKERVLSKRWLDGGAVIYVCQVSKIWNEFLKAVCSGLWRACVPSLDTCLALAVSKNIRIAERRRCCRRLSPKLNEQSSCRGALCTVRLWFELPHGHSVSKRTHLLVDLPAAR